MTRETHQLEIPWFGGFVRIQRVVEHDSAKQPSKPSIDVAGETIYERRTGLVRVAARRIFPVRKSA